MILCDKNVKMAILSSDNSCDSFMYDFHENIALSVVFGLCFIIGLPTVFAGYRVFRFTIFMQSFSIISLVTYILLTELTSLSEIYTGIISGCSGLICGIISIFIYTFGYLCSSLIQSVFLSVCVLYAVNLFVIIKLYYIGTSICAIIWVILFGLTMRWKRSVSLMHTASFGAILIMLSIDFYLDLSLLRVVAYKHIMVERVHLRPCWFSWTLLGIWPILLFLGSLVQFIKTARKYDHTTVDRTCCCKPEREPPVRLLSDKSDVIASAWMSTPSSPRSQKGSRQNMLYEDEVFLMEDTTPV